MKKVEQELRDRILLLLAALSYEEYNFNILSDHEFDALALSINTEIDTGNPELDEWFRKEFNPSTGMWVYKFPELDKLKNKLKEMYPENFGIPVSYATPHK